MPNKKTFETAAINPLRSDSNPFENDSSQVNNSIFIK